MYQLVTEIAPLEDEPTCDWSVKLNFLCYACARDFLSVPKTYAIIEFLGEPDLSIPQLKESYVSTNPAVATLAPGIYQVTTLATDSLNQWLLVDREEVCEFTFQSFRQHPKSYHFESSQHALDDFVGT